MRSRTTFTRIIVSLSVAAGRQRRGCQRSPVASVSPDAALARLKAGNARFVANPVSKGKPTAARRAETAQTQHPFAIIVGCADSRTAPELVFDQNIGDLFVVRTAGNLVDDHGLGSIEYAVDHLGTRLIVVLGHERCGAVKAAMASATAPGHVNSLVRDIQPAVEAAKTEKGDRAGQYRQGQCPPGGREDRQGGRTWRAQVGSPHRHRVLRPGHRRGRVAGGGKGREIEWRAQ